MHNDPSSAAGRRRVRAVLFDFEGTLVDFQWQLAPAEAELRRGFADLGLSGEVFRHGNYAAMWNAAVEQWPAPGQLEQLRRAIYPIYDRWDMDALQRWAPRPGAVELLRQLDAHGARSAMVSNIGRPALDLALQRFGFGPWLAPVVSRNEVSTMKPGAEGIQRALATLQLAPEQALFVGDSRADVLGARAAGVASVIIRGGECGDWLGPEFDAVRPDHMIGRLDEIVGLLRLTT